MWFLPEDLVGREPSVRLFLLLSGWCEGVYALLLLLLLGRLMLGLLLLWFSDLITRGSLLRELLLREFPL